MKITGTIYLITNLVNEKQYVGQTIAPLHKRLNHHLSKYSGCNALSSAIKKYGWENFEVTVLKECSDYFGLNILEIFYINSLNTLAPNGYNLIEGGKSTKRSAETRRRISESKRGAKNPMFGKRASLERRQNISKSLKGLKAGEHNHNSKLTKDDVVVIKARLNRKHTASAVAKDYNVSRGAITSIKLGRTWKSD